MLARLIPMDGGEAHTITQDVTVVGRKSSLCDLTLDLGSISKMHCLIVKTDGLLFVRDLGSTNGTKVNGQRVIRGALLPGDELAFASMKFRVHLGPGEPEVGPDEHTEFLIEPVEESDDEESLFDEDFAEIDEADIVVANIVEADIVDEDDVNADVYNFEEDGDDSEVEIEIE